MKNLLPQYRGSHNSFTLDHSGLSSDAILLLLRFHTKIHFQPALLQALMLNVGTHPAYVLCDLPMVQKQDSDFDSSLLY